MIYIVFNFFPSAAWIPTPWCVTAGWCGCQKCWRVRWISRRQQWRVKDRIRLKASHWSASLVTTSTAVSHYSKRKNYRFCCGHYDIAEYIMYRIRLHISKQYPWDNWRGLFECSCQRRSNLETVHQVPITVGRLEAVWILSLPTEFYTWMALRELQIAAIHTLL